MPEANVAPGLEGFRLKVSGSGWFASLSGALVIASHSTMGQGFPTACALCAHAMHMPQGHRHYVHTVALALPLHVRWSTALRS